MANKKLSISHIFLFNIFLFTITIFTLFSCNNLSKQDNNNVDNRDSSVIVPADKVTRPNKNLNQTLPHSDSLKIQLDTAQVTKPHVRYHERTFNKPPINDDSIKKFDRGNEASSKIKNHEIVYYKPLHQIDSSKLVHDTVKQIQDTHTDNADLKTNTVKRSAILGYSFFKNIQQHDTRNINAYVSVLKEISKVLDTLKQISASDIPQKSNDTATIAARNILLYRYLDIQLLNAGDSDFIIKPLSDEKQSIDSLDGNLWTWAVTPKTYKARGRLIMKVIAEKPNGSREPLPVINIPISITIDKSIFRSIWEWMMTNPEKVITIILIPLVIFFWKQIVGLFKKKTDDKN